ncbi:putative amidoligase enzyme-domain-containing protein [Xylaria digitata]|nr:putative amidoligase enzyme-domain-containing protein [Xylaria digitata]
MSVNTFPNLELPTFGVEVEFMIATLPEDDEIIDPDENGLPPILRIPKRSNNLQTIKYTLGKVKGVLDECFGVLPPLSALKVDTKAILDKYRDWNVDGDSSIRPPKQSSYRFVGVEVISPVQFASPKGFNAIRLAILAITSKFRCMVNLSCGLHVHVGLGIERLPLEQIRRIASLSYAAEPLLFTLHGPSRRVHDYCRSLHDYSRLANGVIGKDLEGKVEHSDPHLKEDLGGECYTYLGAVRRHGEEALSARNKHVDKTHIEAFLETRQPGHYEPFTRPDDSRHTKLLPEISDHILTAQRASSSSIIREPARQRNIPRLRLPKPTLSELLRVRKELEPVDGAVPLEIFDRLGERGPGPGVFEATKHIYSQPASCYISSLLSGELRPAINFESYSCRSLRPAVDQRTVEFRMGEGSLDAEWVSTWAKIIVGLFKFALYSTPSNFIAVLENCDRVMKEDGTYDIIDMLDDMGLFAEAEIAERRLTANKDRWNLEFVESESNLVPTM